ncbi:Hpt domain-containing protein [Aurantiacibacter poecillastricola]|uniref:Hpt domain-containing protein n=1 Tax=Aurantiacibacter poecillastricola TaxID=3064385 RepID=UPI00273EB9D9|nr:Hpt domain-containing protein [Aurantiacibacter sp. 219JJ12-13]MDP5262395.1 Hpt domain-containing protein [Aurantiacibacter sp. 219JJ12-13]
MSAEIEARMAQMAERFAARAGEYRAILQEAVARDDREAVCSQAHKLAGIAAMFGHPEIGEAAARLEDIGEAGGDYRPAADHLAALLSGLGT